MQVLGQIVSSFAEAKDITLTLTDENGTQSVQTVRTPAVNAHAPGEASAVYTLTLNSDAATVLTMHQSEKDSLASDDTAGILVPPVFRPRIALVQSSSKESPPDQVLPEILQSTEPASLTELTDEAYEQLDASEVDSGSRFDVIVFDHVSPKRLPAIPTLTFGGVPPGASDVGSGAASEPEAASRPAPRAQTSGVVLTWDRTNSVLRNVSLDNLRYTGFTAFEQSPTLTPLASGTRGPVMASVRARGATHVFVGFALADSNWRLDISLLILIQNVLDDLPGKELADEGLAVRPGEPVTLRADAHADRIRLAQQSASLDFAVQSGAMTTIRAPSHVGIWSVSGAAAPVDVLPVSVLSEAESDLRPRPELTVNSEAATATYASGVAPMELWPMLAGAAVVLLVIEWLVYSRQVAAK
ncbi:MAG TPA: hypothetical protein VG711_02430 [Phycisphaerales bacterium]|nr:hypothetical protein [Phycisphaerales bacterium]